MWSIHLCIKTQADGWASIFRQSLFTPIICTEQQVNLAQNSVLWWRKNCLPLSEIKIDVFNLLVVMSLFRFYKFLSPYFQQGYMCTTYNFSSKTQTVSFLKFLVSNLMHLFIISLHILLHVSSHIVLIIRRIYCIYTASGSLCVTLLVWPFCAQACAPNGHTRRVTHKEPDAVYIQQILLMMSTIWLETCRGIWKDIINKCIRLETRNQISQEC